MNYLKPYKDAVRKVFPDLDNEDQISVMAFFAFAKRVKDKEDLRPINYDKYRQMELDSLNEEMIFSYGGRQVG